MSRKTTKDSDFVSTFKPEYINEGDNKTFGVPGKIVTVHYTGYLTNGNKFDSSEDRKKPFSFQLGAGKVIPGWEQVVSRMSVGEKIKVTIPYKLAYGEEGIPNVIPKKADLVFEIEFLK